MKRTPVVLGALLVLALTMAACGSSEPAGPVTVEMRMTDDFAYDPGEITVGPGAELTIVATNESDLNTKHDLVLLGDVFDGLGDINRAIEADPAIVLAEFPEVEPGGTDSITVTLDEPGTYQYYCSVQGHFAAGMQGTVTVEG